MSTYNYTISDLPSLGLTAAPLNYTSLAADSLQLRFIPTATTTTPTWAEGDRITLDDDYGRLFSGIVDNIEYGYTGDAYYIDITLYNDLKQLELTTYTKLKSDGTPYFSQYFGSTTSLAEANVIVTDCFNLAKNSSSSVMSCTLSNGLDSQLPIVVGSGSSSCLALINTALKWSPDVYSYMRYSEEGDTLAFKHSRDLETITINATTKTITRGEPEQLTEATYASTYVAIISPQAGDTLIIDATEFVRTTDGWNDTTSTLNAAAALIDLINATVTCVVASGGATEITLTASEAGAAGNNIVVSLNADCSADLAIKWNSSLRDVNLEGGADATYSDPETLGTFETLTSVKLKARHDLVPPCVAITGKYNKVLPSGGDAQAPNALVYHIASGSYMTTELSDEQAYSIAAQTAPTATIRGLSIPDGWVTDTSTMRTLVTTTVKASCLKFWSQFPAFSLLSQLDSDCLQLGGMRIEPVAGADAYPLSELEEMQGTEQSIPANYSVISTSDLAWYQRAAVLIDGSFPASSDSRNNLSALKFCRATIYQNILLTAANCGVTAEQWSNFFSGSSTYTIDETQRKCRTICLAADVVLINRTFKRYKTGTNTLTSDDPDYEESTDSGTSSSEGYISEAQYQAFLQDVYDNTRHLYHDGSLTLLGCKLPAAELLGCGVNIVGLNPAWETMDSPASAVSYDPHTQRLSLTVGSRDYLSIDEQIARKQALASLYSSAATEALTDTDSLNLAQGNTDNDEDEDAATTELVSPCISTSTSTALLGRPLAPFELYAKGDTWYVAEGILSTPDGDLEVAEVAVPSDLSLAGYDIKVKAVYDSTTSSYKTSYRRVLRS